MSEVLIVLQVAIEAAFAALAVKTALSWARQPDQRHGFLALALGSLAVLVLVAPLLSGAAAGGQLILDFGVVLFLVSGYSLLMFRDTFVPFKPVVRGLIGFGGVAVGLLGIVVQLPSNPDGPHSPIQSIALVALIAFWAFCILEPITTFWRAASGRPAVERMRLRAISAGYAGLLSIVVFGTVAGSLNPLLSLVVDLLTLAIVPVLYVAFFPPAWLRRIWRQPEEDQFRLALHDLLLYSPDRATLADRALVWAERLVGADSGFAVDADGSILAARGIASEDAAKRVETSGYLRASAAGHAAWREGASVVAPLDLREGRGAMVIITGRLTPIFGDDELTRLTQYSASITAGLDRVSLNARIAALERAKTDFLNIASHELRGPMTVIKGYLTMLESGALGELAPKAESVLPLLISKSDEVNWMIEQMIEASRLEEGRLALKTRKHDIVELTDMAIDGVKMLLSGHDLKVEEPAEAIDADVDPDRFQIVVRNLLSNAAKYSPSGTNIEVEVRRNDKTASVAVTDHGAGISPEDQTHLFKRFGRIESLQHVQGTGLGLWLSREIARMHHGDLTVKSNVGIGSTFTFVVPVTQ